MSSKQSPDTSTLQLTCPDCGWSGLGIECIDDEIVEGVINRACPTCGRTLALGDRVFAWVLEPAGTPSPGPGQGAADREGSDRG
jgi:predicted RNA-binding Zn-ribbon protein involved in translation (DUF1610 family)